ncbi:MAG TPA: cysteine desulfurase, partial [Tepidisphaeraceae bacterium]|nr:cysteine desulfurase [Tepidisphaeraceae bacterium]
MDFPILSTRAGSRDFVYFDNGATTQKPYAVIEAIDSYYRNSNANIHRAVHQLSQRATDLFESTRVKVQRFINAPAREEVIFTRGTTESINLVASSFCAKFMNAGDEIVLSALEHHSNIVPWQLAAERHGLTIRVIPIDDSGELLYDELPKLINQRTKLIAITHTSNALGTIVDISQIVAHAKRVGARVLVDGAQWVGHNLLDVQKLGVDFYAFSGHKLFAPTGSGVLWGKRELLDAMPPYQGGGDMIHTVSFEKTTYAELPNKFEAGTPDIAAIVGLGAGIDYLNSLDFSARFAHEQRLLEYATRKLDEVGVRIIGR